MDWSGCGLFFFGGKLYYTLVTKLTDYTMAPTKVGVFYVKKYSHYSIKKLRMIKNKFHQPLNRFDFNMDNSHLYFGTSVCKDERYKRPCFTKT